MKKMLGILFLAGIISSFPIQHWDEGAKSCYWNAPCLSCLDSGCYFIVPEGDRTLCLADWKPFKGRVATILTPRSQGACSRQPTPAPDPTQSPVISSTTRRSSTPAPPMSTTDRPIPTASPIPMSTSTYMPDVPTKSPPAPVLPESPSSSVTWIVIAFFSAGVTLIMTGVAVWRHFTHRGQVHYAPVPPSSVFGLHERANLLRRRSRIDTSDLAHLELDTETTFSNPAFRAPQSTVINPQSGSTGSLDSVNTVMTNVPLHGTFNRHGLFDDVLPSPLIELDNFGVTGNASNLNALLEQVARPTAAASARNDEEDEMNEVYLDASDDAISDPPILNVPRPVVAETSFGNSPRTSTPSNVDIGSAPGPRRSKRLQEKCSHDKATYECKFCK